MFTQSDLDAINAAIASGELTVRSSDGKQITYRSVSELLQARQTIEADLAANRTNRPRTGRFTFTTMRGF
ncbi:MAG: hypothetical protein LRY31_01090 [Burkholderiaceae bacterium]|nr:hypothetical protein [Burkholderiaceae bacterium]